MFHFFKKKSASYWDRRYKVGGNSGAGSYGLLADFKKEIIDRFCADHQIKTIIEFDCGDGNQLSLLQISATYIGLDISPEAVKLCRRRFATDSSRQFLHFTGKAGFCESNQLRADLCMSLDVLYHLVEDDVFKSYMSELFSASTKYVMIYSTDFDQHENLAWHVRHRKFSSYIAQEFPEFELVQHIPNRFPPGNDKGEESAAEFFIYSRRNRR